MYKLTLLKGKNRGSSFVLREGDTHIGRQAGNEIVLESSKISKRHCRLVVSDGQVIVHDEGSSNGTFVNGQLVKTREIQPGDKVAVGDFIFELRKPKTRRSAPALGGLGEVIRLPTAGGSSGSNLSIPQFMAASEPAPSVQNAVVAAPDSLPGKAVWAFEHRLMPFFYKWNLGSEWKQIGLTLFGVFFMLQLMLAVWPLLDGTESYRMGDLRSRAMSLARQLGDRNQVALATGNESRVEVGSLETEAHVAAAYVLGIDGKVISPAREAGKFLAQGDIAIEAQKMSQVFRRGLETTLSSRTEDGRYYVAGEPIRVYNPQAGRNSVMAVALVAVETDAAKIGFGTRGMIYSQTALITAAFGLLLALIFYRLTVRPVQILSEDIDKALRGEINEVSREFQVDHLKPLYDLVNTAIQRIPQDGVSASSNASLDPNQIAEELSVPMRSLAEFSDVAMVVLNSDRNVVSLNDKFEEITGIRQDNAIGRDLPSQARDQAFVALCNELLERAYSGGEGASEDFEFSGVNHRVRMVGIGPSGGVARAYVMWIRGLDG